MTTGVADKRAERHFLTGKGSGQNLQEYSVEAAKVTAMQINSHEGSTWS